MSEQARAAERARDAQSTSPPPLATIVLDAYAVVAYLRGEPAADDVADLLRTPTVLASVNAAEIVDQLTRVFGRDGDHVLADLALLPTVGMILRPLWTRCFMISSGCGPVWRRHRATPCGRSAPHGISRCPEPLLIMKRQEGRRESSLKPRHCRVDATGECAGRRWGDDGH